MIARLLGGLVIGAGVGALLGYFGKCTSGRCPLTANPVRGAVLGGVFGVLVVWPCGRECKPRLEAAPGTGEQGNATNQVETGAVVHVTDEDGFSKHVLQAKLPCLADFFSNSCPPCRMLGPTIEAIADRYKGKAVVCKVSLDHKATHGLARKYDIAGIPTVLFFENGKEAQRLVGLQSEEEYVRVLDEMTQTTGR